MADKASEFMNEELVDKLNALRHSAGANGTSNRPVEVFATAVVNMFYLQQSRINGLETLLRDVMENHGLSAGL
jgi:hypothetical protein